MKTSANEFLLEQGVNSTCCFVHSPASQILAWVLALAQGGGVCPEEQRAV